MGFLRGRRREQMQRSFKDSLKDLEADIHFANALASDYPRDSDDVFLQMKLSYSPAAQFFLVLFQWADCHLAGAFGLLTILIYKTYDNGKTTMTDYERKASLKEFYGALREVLHNPDVIGFELFPNRCNLSLFSATTKRNHCGRPKDLCAAKNKSEDAMNKRKISDIDIERENECDICMEMGSKVVLPICSHSMCIKCYQDWRARSQSCPFCRRNLTQVNSDDLWIFMSSNEINDLGSIIKENVNRLFMYIDKLPHLVPDPIFTSNPQHW